MKIEDWGILNYRDAWQKQRDIVSALQSESASEEVIALVEHNPVYTLGFHANEKNMLVSGNHLNSIGMECVRIERGGDITYHGPGQLVVYPLLNLRKHGLGVKKYIETLEHIVIDLLSEYGIKSESNNEAIGVWLDWGTGSARKICAIGVKVSHAITMHGFALNVNTNLDAFNLINPCGITDKGVTSLQKELNQTVDMNQLKQNLKKIIKKYLS